MGGKDIRALKIFGKGSPEVGVLEQAEILRLGCIGGADLSRLDREIGLAETAAREQFIIWYSEKKKNRSATATSEMSRLLNKVGFGGKLRGRATSRAVAKNTYSVAPHQRE